MVWRLNWSMFWWFHLKFSRFNNPSQLTAPRLVLSTHTILSAGFSFLDASNNAFVEAIDMEYVSDFLWSYQAWCVRHNIKSWTMSIILLDGCWAIPIDCLVISDDLLAHEAALQWDKTTSERLLEREMDRWRQSSEIIRGLSPRLFLTSTWTVFDWSTIHGHKIVAV